MAESTEEERDSARRLAAFEEVDKRLQELEDRERDGNKGRQALMDSITGVLDGKWRSCSDCIAALMKKRLVLSSARQSLGVVGTRNAEQTRSEEGMVEILREQLVEAQSCREVTAATLQKLREVHERFGSDNSDWKGDCVKQVEKRCEELETNCNVLKGKLVRAQVEVSTLRRRLLNRTMGFAILLIGLALGVSNFGD